MTLTIPSSWKTKESVERTSLGYAKLTSVNFDPSCEAMIFDHSGMALQGESRVYIYADS